MYICYIFQAEKFGNSFVMDTYLSEKTLETITQAVSFHLSPLPSPVSTCMSTHFCFSYFHPFIPVLLITFLSPSTPPSHSLFLPSISSFSLYFFVSPLLLTISPLPPPTYLHLPLFIFPSSSSSPPYLIIITLHPYFFLRISLSLSSSLSFFLNPIHLLPLLLSHITYSI